MENDNKNVVVPSVINVLACLLFLEIIIFSVIFIINGQVKNAIDISIINTTGIFIAYICMKRTLKINPNFLANNTNILQVASTIITFMGVLFISCSFMIDKHSYKIGDIQIKFPKENGYIYGRKDANKKYYYAEYYHNYCLIEMQKSGNNSRYSVFENIKQNVKLDNKITDSVSLEDIYNSNFIEGKATINGKEWNTYYTQVDNVKYTIYYLIIENDIYQINTANYNENPSICTNKIDETFKTIKYNN